MATSSNLAPRELYRYNWRTELFLKKYREGLPLTLVNGGEAILEYDRTVEQLIESRGNSRFTMKGVDGKSYTLSNFAKTDDRLLAVSLILRLHMRMRVGTNIIFIQIMMIVSSANLPK